MILSKLGKMGHEDSKAKSDGISRRITSKPQIHCSAYRDGRDARPQPGTLWNVRYLCSQAMLISAVERTKSSDAAHEYLLEKCIYTNKSPASELRRGIVRENIGERTALSGCHQVMDA